MSEEQIPIATLAKVYRKIRGRVEILTQEYEREVAELKQQQEEVANAMREQMKAMGVKSVNTDHGTVMLGLKTRYNTQDWDAFKAFIVEHDALDLMEKRIAQGNMATFLKDNPGVIPPGLTSDSEYTITVRKPT
jgi:hypothetical protein